MSDEAFNHGLQLATAAAAADVEFDRHYERADGSRWVPPGGEFPPVDDEYGAAMEQQSAADTAFKGWIDHWRIALTPDQLEQILKARSTHT